MIEATSTRKSRIGFIGAGNFATRTLYPLLHLCPQIDLVSICDVDLEKAKLNARNFGARRVYTDIDEMLDKEQLDGVFCIGSAPQQYELAPKVIRRGLPVYVEKPSASTSGQARELAELAQAHRTWGQVGFMKRFADGYAMAKEVISRPEFGAVTMVKTKFAQGPYPQLWGLDSAKRSFLVGQICHICDLARYFGGEVDAVSSFYHEVTPTQFAFAVTVKYASGAVGLFDWNTLEATGFRDIEERLEVAGVESNLVVRDMMELHWQPRRDWTAVSPDSGRYLHSFKPAPVGSSMLPLYGYAAEVAHFALKCIGEATGGPDLWDSYHALKIGEAVHESAESGRTVSIDSLR